MTRAPGFIERHGLWNAEQARLARELAVRMGGGLRVTSTKEFTAFTLDLPPGVVRELTGPLASGARS